MVTSFFALLLVKFIFEASDLRGFAFCADSVGTTSENKERPENLYWCHFNSGNPYAHSEHKYIQMKLI